MVINYNKLMLVIIRLFINRVKCNVDDDDDDDDEELRVTFC